MDGNKKPNDSYYGQVSDSIKGVFEMTARIDERVQLMMKKQDELDNKIDLQIAFNNQLAARLSVLENDRSVESLEHNMEKVWAEINQNKAQIHDLDKSLQGIQGSSDRQENRWKGVLGFVVQLIWVILASYILYRLGIQSPNLP